MVSELFDPDAWRPVRARTSPTSPITGRSIGHRAGRLQPARGAQRVPAAHGRRAVRRLDHARQSADVGCVLLTGNGPSPKDGGWAFCSGGDQRIRGADGYQYAEGERPGIEPAGRPAAHPGGAAADPVHAQGRDLRGARLGGGRRAQPARRLATSPWPAPSTPGSSRPTPTSPASTAGSARRTWPARSGRSSPGRSSSSARTYTAEDAHRMGMVNAVVPHADLERVALQWAARGQRQEPDRAAHAQVRVQPRRRRAGRPAAVRRRGHPPGLRHRRGRGGPRRVPREAVTGLGRRSPGITDPRQAAVSHGPPLDSAMADAAATGSSRSSVAYR